MKAIETTPHFYVPLSPRMCRPDAPLQMNSNGKRQCYASPSRAEAKLVPPSFSSQNDGSSTTAMITEPITTSAQERLDRQGQITEHPPPRKRARKSVTNVRFAPRDSFSALPSALEKLGNSTNSSRTPEEEASSSSSTNNSTIGLLWYTKQDIRNNRNQARYHALGLVTTREGEETTRGFERYELDRLRNKSLAIKCILLVAQQPLRTEEEIAAVARECTSCARHQAILTGSDDFFQAQHHGI